MENNEIPGGFEPNTANYLFHVIDFHRSMVEAILHSGVDGGDLLAMFAFMTAVIETQVPNANQSFDEMRAFYDGVYPSLLEATKEAGLVGDKEMVLIIPRPLPDAVTQDPTSEDSPLIIPGSSLIN